MATTASDKAQLISQGQIMAPGYCALCGSGSSEQGYLDIKLWIDFHGQIYFCYRCVEQFIQAIDGLTFEEANEIKKQHLNDQSTILALREKLEQAQDELRSLRSAISIVSSNISDDTSVSNSVHAEPTPREDVNGEGLGEGAGTNQVGLDDSEVGETESEPTESVEDERPDKPSSLTASDLGI